MLVVVSETVGPFDDVISARVFGLPDSEMCARDVQHSKDKATKNVPILHIAEYLLSKAVRTKESRQITFRMLPLHCPHSHCLAGEYHIQ